MATTTNYGWTTPDDTALVKDGAAAIRTLGSSVDTTTKALNPSTTLGDIEYRSSTANTNTRLGIGTTGQVLTVSGGVPAWAAPVAGGMTLINTGGTTLTGASVTISSIPSTYKNLYLIVTDFLPATNQAGLCVRINGDSGSNRYYNNYFSDAGSQSGNGRSFDDTKLFLCKNQFSTSTNSLITATFPDYTNTITWKTAVVHSIANYDGSGIAFVGQIGVHNQTIAISSLVLLCDTGNLTSGTAYLYGVS
jgi:hypothetical protein